MIRITVRIVLLAAVFFTPANAIRGCSFDMGKTTIYFTNMGLDPIHVGRVRVGQNETREIADVENGGMGFTEALTRENINLGTISVWQRNSNSGEYYTATITMTEPTYFDFHFSSNNPDVEVTYSGP